MLTAVMLPMEPQPNAAKRQWFEGWFFRLVDSDHASSVAVIFGSLRRPDRGSGSFRSPFFHANPFLPLNRSSLSTTFGSTIDLISFWNSALN